jgi:hypothetical protein
LKTPQRCARRGRAASGKAALLRCIPPSPPARNSRRRRPGRPGVACTEPPSPCGVPCRTSKYSHAREERTAWLFSGVWPAACAPLPSMATNSVLLGLNPCHAGRSSGRENLPEAGGGGGRKLPAAHVRKYVLVYVAGLAKTEGDTGWPARHATRRLPPSRSACLANSRACSSAATWLTNPLLRGTTRTAAPGTR